MGEVFWGGGELMRFVFVLCFGILMGDLADFGFFSAGRLMCGENVEFGLFSIFQFIAFFYLTHMDFFFPIHMISDVQDLRANCQYEGGYFDQHRTIRAFWQVRKPPEQTLPSPRKKTNSIPIIHKN